MRKPLSLILAFLVLNTGCKDDENPIVEQTPVGGNTIVSARFNWVWDNAPFNANDVFTSGTGELMKFHRARFFVAQPSFNDDAGNVVASFPERYMLVDVNEGTLVRTIGEVNAHLHTMDFTLGLDSLANHNDLFAANEPPLNDASMSWGWNPAQGYLFMQLEGKFDSNDDGLVDGNDTDFIYHCATDDLRRDAQVDVHTDALTGGALILDMQVDMKAVIGNLDVAANSNAQGNNAVTDGLMDRLRSAVTLP